MTKLEKKRYQLHNEYLDAAAKAFKERFGVQLERGMSLTRNEQILLPPEGEYFNLYHNVFMTAFKCGYFAAAERVHD